jgi:hypothetical protein
MAWLTMPAKVARLSARTSANAGSTPVSEDRAAPASDHDQADEQQQQDGLHRGLRDQERGQHRDQRGSDRRRVRGRRELAGQPGRHRVRPVEVIEQGLRSVRADATNGEREQPLHVETRTARPSGW